MADEEIPGFPPPELEDWDDAEPPPSPALGFAVALGALIALAVGLVVVLAALDGDEQPERPAADGTTPLSPGSVEAYNPTGYDGAGARAALEAVSVTADGEAVVLAFSDVLPAGIDRDRSDRAGRGSCDASGPDPVGDAFVNVRLEGGVDLSGLDGLVVASGSIVTGRAPIGAVRSLTVTCHGAAETVIAIGLHGDRFVSIDERPDDGLVLVEFFSR